MANSDLLLAQDFNDYARVRLAYDELASQGWSTLAINYNVRCLADAQFILEQSDINHPDYPILFHYIYELGMFNQVWDGMLSLSNLALLSWLSQEPYIDNKCSCSLCQKKLSNPVINWAGKVMLELCSMRKVTSAVNFHRYMRLEVDRIYDHGLNYFKLWLMNNMKLASGLSVNHKMIEAMIKFHPDLALAMLKDSVELSVNRHMIMDLCNPSLIIEQLDAMSNPNEIWKIVKVSVLIGITHYWDTYWQPKYSNCLTNSKYINLLLSSINTKHIHIIKRILNAFVVIPRTYQTDNHARMAGHVIFHEYNPDILTLFLDHLRDGDYSFFVILTSMRWNSQFLNHVLSYLKSHNLINEINQILSYMMTKPKNIDTLKSIDPDLNINCQDHAIRTICLALDRTLSRIENYPSLNLRKLAVILTRLDIKVDLKQASDILIVSRNRAVRMNKQATKNYVISLVNFVNSYHQSEKDKLMIELYNTMVGKWPKPMADTCFFHIKTLVKSHVY